MIRIQGISKEMEQKSLLLEQSCTRERMNIGMYHYAYAMAQGVFMNDDPRDLRSVELTHL